MSAYNLGTASGRIEIDGRAGAAGFKVVETAANTFFGVVQRKVDSIKQMGRRMQIAGASGVAGFGVAIKAASDFEKQMSGVRAVAGGTEEDFEKLRNKALQLGADTSFSASEAALAIEELAKAGIPIADILNGAAEGAVALAAAGGVSLPEAATIASNAMNQFGLDASKVTDVADILAGVANVSAADVSSLGQSLSQAGAVANLAGLNFKDTAIALGEMADAGINGSDAGTSLKTMLNNLIPTTTKQINKFKELGLLQYDLAQGNKVLAKEHLPLQKNIDGVYKVLGKYMEELDKGEVGTAKNAKAVQDLMLKTGVLNNEFFDAQGNIKNLAGLQGTLGKALRGMTKEQKLSTLETLFGADAMRASAILSLEGAKGYREFAKEVDKTSAAEVAKERLNNLSGSVEAFKGSMETAMITIGNIFLPAITKIVQGATWLVNAFNNLPGPIKTAIGIIVGVVSILGILIGTLLASLTVIAAFIAQWYAFRIIRIATGFLRSFFVTMKAGAGIQAAFNAGLATSTTRTARLAKVTAIAGKTMLLFGKLARAAWLALTGPIGLVVLAVLALIAVGVLLYKKWAPFRELVDKTAAALKGAFLSAWAALKPMLQSAGEWLAKIGDIIATDVMPMLEAAGAALRGAFGEAFTQISEAVNNDLLPALQGFGDVISNDVLPALKDAWEAIEPIAKIVGVVLAVALYIAFKAWLAFAKIMIGVVYPILLKIFGFLLGGAVKGLVMFIKGVANFVSGLIKMFSGLINFFVGLFTGDWSRMWEGIKQIFSGAWQAIKGTFQMAIAGIVALVHVLWNLLKSVFVAGWNFINGLTGGKLSALVGLIRSGFQVTVAIVRGVFGVLRAIVRTAWNVIKTIFQAAIAVIKAIVSGNFGAIPGIILGAMGKILGFLRNGWNQAKNATTEAFGRIKQAISTGVAQAVVLVGSMPGKILDGLGNLGQYLYNKGVELISGFVGGITDKMGDAVGAVKSGLGKIGGLLPGSPIKWGPLKSWNRGGAGKRLVGMLADGLRDTTPIERAMRGVATYVNGVNLMMEPAVVAAPASVAVAARPTPTTVGPAARVRPAKRKGSGKKESRIIRGELHIGPDGRVWIEGIAQDVYDENEEFKNDQDPKGGRRG